MVENEDLRKIKINGEDVDGYYVSSLGRFKNKKELCGKRISLKLLLIINLN